MRHHIVHVRLELGDQLSRNLVWTLCHWSPAVRFNVLQSARIWETRELLERQAAMQTFITS